MKILRIEWTKTWTVSIYENFLMCDQKNIICFLGIIITLFVLSKKFWENNQIYTIPTIFLKLSDSPKDYARKRRYTAEQLQEIQNQVKWKSPTNYPPTLKPEYFKLKNDILNEGKNKNLTDFKNFIISDSDYEIIEKKLKYMKIKDCPPYGKNYPKYKTLFTRPMEHHYIPPDDDRAPIHHRSEDYLSWDAEWDYMVYVWDQLAFSIPILIIFLFIHWIIAETLLVKFKCQQHSQLNKWVFGIGPIFIYYLYCHYKFLYYDYSLGCWLADFELVPYIYVFSFFQPEWPIYMILYDWWLYLIGYCTIVIFFFFFGPKTIYLRNNDNLSKTKYILNFIFIFIGLLLPPLFAQKQLPFWQSVEKILFIDPDKIQFHYGVTYLIIIIIVITLTSLLWFYLIIIISNTFKAYIYSDKSYYDDIEWLLFSGESDDSDWNKGENVPNSLKNPFLTRNMLNLKTTGESDFRPDGFEYKKFKVGDTIQEKYLWTGSYSKWILLIWYLSISFYCLILKILYTYISWSAILLLVIACFLILNIAYLTFTIKVLKNNILFKKKFKVCFILYSVSILTLIIIFLEDFFYLIY